MPHKEFGRIFANPPQPETGLRPSDPGAFEAFMDSSIAGFLGPASVKIIRNVSGLGLSPKFMETLLDVARINGKSITEIKSFLRGVTNAEKQFANVNKNISKTRLGKSRTGAEKFKIAKTESDALAFEKARRK